MYLKRIEIQGFKSFADPVTIDFKEGITCIIGPNGSGKSNISDAMRWVLGEQSAKTLRGGKMEEVIFAGTESRRSRGMAEVALIIDNSEGILPIDYSEVSIKRRLFRSGESEYLINNNPCRLKDIRNIIMDTGIGVDGYSFIGQGQVDRIVGDKPESHREIFEEAAGIIKYKTQKKEAKNKIDSTQNNLDRMNDIILDIESRIDGLREESEKAKEHALISERHRELEINITLKNIDTVKEKNKELKSQLDEASNALESLRAKKVELDTELEAMRRKNDDMESFTTDLREKISENVNQTLHLRSNAMINEEKHRSLEKDKSRLESEIESLNARIQSEEKQSQSLLEDKRENDAKLETLTLTLNDRLNVAAAAAANLASITADMEEKKAQVYDLSRERSLKEAELSSNLDLMKSFDQTKERFKEDLYNTRVEKKELETEVQDAESRKNIISEDLKKLTDEEAEIKETYGLLTRAIDEKQKEIEELRIKSEQLSSRKKTIEEMESNYEGYNYGVKSLMKDSNISGMDGVVAELIKVPKGFETAIETALGATLQNIICEDDASAKKAIKYLKENKAGRLTFLPVSSIKARKAEKAKALEGEEGFEGYAIDCLNFDDKYREVFEYLLGKTIIVDNLDNAVAMSKANREGYKLVTLGGEIVNVAGALTGGAYKNKSANILVRKGEIDTLAADILDIDNKRKDSTDEREKMNKDAAAQMSQLAEIDKTSREKTSTLATINGEIKSLEYRIQDIDNRQERINRNLNNVGTDKEKNSGINDDLKAGIKNADEKIASLDAEIERCLAQIEVAVLENNEASEEVTTVRVMTAAAETQKANSDANAEQLLRAINELKEELSVKQAEIEEILSTELENIEEEDLVKRVVELETEKAEFDEELETLVAERNDLRRQIEERAYSLNGISDQIDNRAEAKASMEVELGRQETRLQNWKDKLYEEFDLSYVHAMDFRKSDFVMSNAVKENREIKVRLLEIGEVNPGSIKEYDETKERYDFLTVQRDDILKSMEDYQKIVDEADKISKVKFLSTFDAVSANFDNTCKMLFGGGNGKIKLDDELDPLECGISISIRLPGKASLENINSYSGGEKSMIGIALMFAILKAKPTPFCILDEIDAALDEANIRRFADYIRSITDTQFALVTHQRSTMEYANAIFGVTMQEQGITTILSLLLGDEQTDEFAKNLDQ